MHSVRTCPHPCSYFYMTIYISSDLFILKCSDSGKFDCLMQLNHIFKTRDLVTKNDAKVAKHQGGEDGDGSLDHGFTRPKVILSAFVWCDSDCKGTWICIIV